MSDLSSAGERLEAARSELRAAVEAAKAAAVADVARGVSEVEAARRHALTRPTVRKALGKDQA